MLIKRPAGSLNKTTLYLSFYTFFKGNFSCIVLRFFRCFFGFGTSFRRFSTSFWAVNVVNDGFWCLKAPETSIWAPEGAFRGFRAVYSNFPSFFAGARAWARGPGPAKKDGKLCFFERVLQFANLRNAGFWRSITWSSWLLAQLRA